MFGLVSSMTAFLGARRRSVWHGGRFGMGDARHGPMRVSSVNFDVKTISYPKVSGFSWRIPAAAPDVCVNPVT